MSGHWRDIPGVKDIASNNGTADAVRAFLVGHGIHVTKGNIRRDWNEHGWGPPNPDKGGRAPSVPSFTSDKKVGVLNWREANAVMRQMHALKKKASGSQDYATIRFLEHIDHPVTITGLCDLHMASWGSDPDTLERITDEILGIDDLYVGLLGDEEAMNIKMRSVMEMQDQMLPTGMEHMYFESWMDEIQPKLLFSCWENHAAMREEATTGFSYSSEIKKRRVIYHNGIGHTDIHVGSQVYKFAVSHFFKGRSIYNATHGQQRYTKWEGQDRDIVMAGDSHVPGVSQWWEAGRKKVALNGGSNQTNSGYGKRFFSLTTADTWPCVTLFPDTRRFIPYWSIAEFLAATGRSHLIKHEEAS